MSTRCHCGYAVAERLTFCPMCGRDAAGHRRPEGVPALEDRYYEDIGAREWVRIRGLSRWWR